MLLEMTPNRHRPISVTVSYLVLFLHSLLGFTHLEQGSQGICQVKIQWNLDIRIL